MTFFVRNLATAFIPLVCQSANNSLSINTNPDLDTVRHDRVERTILAADAAWRGHGGRLSVDVEVFSSECGEARVIGNLARVVEREKRRYQSLEEVE